MIVFIISCYHDIIGHARFANRRKNRAAINSIYNVRLRILYHNFGEFFHMIYNVKYHIQ